VCAPDDESDAGADDEDGGTLAGGPCPAGSCRDLAESGLDVEALGRHSGQCE
jgi:hypothetical protein